MARLKAEAEEARLKAEAEEEARQKEAEEQEGAEPVLEDAQGQCRVGISVPDYWVELQDEKDPTGHCTAARDRTFDQCRYKKASLAALDESSWRSWTATTS